MLGGHGDAAVLVCTVRPMGHDEQAEDAGPTGAELDDLTAYLLGLYVAAGRPAVRAVARATGISHTRVHNYLHGAGGTASWVRVATLVAHLGGDEAAAQPLWESARNRHTSARAWQTVAKAPGVTEQLDTIAGLLTEILGELRQLAASQPDSHAQ